MLPKQKIFAIIISCCLISLIFILVKKRKLKEEYSWLWILTGGSIFLLSIWDQVLVKIGRLIGIIDPASVLFFLGMFFIVLICLHFCIKLSMMVRQIKILSQKITLMEDDINTGNG